MKTPEYFDLIIVGAGIGGILCLKYAKDAGLNAIVLERASRVGGLWRDLPPWQDIQFRKEDWTLGNLPIEGEDQPSVLRNIEAWVERFDLLSRIRLGVCVRAARPCVGGWKVTTDAGELESRFLVGATGGHNRPVVPQVARDESSIAEYHSSELRDPKQLRDKAITVVGGGASAYDLLDLCFRNGARSVAWVYRSTKWMRPTLQPKYFGTDIRTLARLQMLGVSVDAINHRINRDLRERYRKAGIAQIQPDQDFDLRRDQLIPGRRDMIRNFARIARHRGEVRALRGSSVKVTDGASLPTDLLLWATGYAVDLSYLEVDALARETSLSRIRLRCASAFHSLDASDLFLLAPAVLETNTSTPWAYAHAARSIMAHIGGRAALDAPAQVDQQNHFELVRMLAQVDRANYPPFGFWRLKYLGAALLRPRTLPMPIP